MNPIHFCIMALPLSVYLFLLGWLHLRRCPFVTTVGRDIAMVAVAISGLVVIGPMELFFPENAVARFGPYVWLMLLAFYGLTTAMIAMMVRPGLVIYNVQEDQLRPVLADVLGKLDHPQWMGENVRVPGLNIHFHVETYPWLRTVQLVSSGGRQSLNGWRTIELELARVIRQVPSQPNLYGPMFLTMALILNLVGVVWMCRQPEQVIAGWQQLIRL